MLKAINAIFNDPTARKLFLKLRYALSVVFVVVLAHYADASLLLPAFAVSLVGEFIQLWSFASLVKNDQLTARGPYVLVRNPMYLGRFVLILGLVLLLNNIYLTAAYCVLYYFYMANRVQREENRLAQMLGDPYLGYCRHTSRFIPSLAGFANPAVWFFRWDVLRRNNGQWNLLAMLAAYAVLYVYFFYGR
jgi:protein-S-isoprenylcysteine O-methyltransferase Ste14